jgi:predicted porin
VQYQLTDALSLGGEIFHQSGSSTAEAGSLGFPLRTKDTSGFNLGGVYDLNKTYHTLFSFGRALEDVSADSAFSYYLALRVTLP